VCAWIDDTGSHGFDYSPSLTRLLKLPHARAMIDIPIGLPPTGNRVCDEQAARILGPSVFVGVRRSLLNFEKYEQANEYYKERNEPSVSRQLWSIREKIREVDGHISVSPARQEILSETHPELIFWSHHSNTRLARKKSSTGRSQRVEILKRLGFKKIDHWLDLRYGTGIGRDDLIDACACAIAARDAKRCLGSNQPDGRGLRMEMHY